MANGNQEEEARFLSWETPLYTEGKGEYALTYGAEDMPQCCVFYAPFSHVPVYNKPYMEENAHRLRILFPCLV